MFHRLKKNKALWKAGFRVWHDDSSAFFLFFFPVTRPNFSASDLRKRLRKRNENRARSKQFTRVNTFRYSSTYFLYYCNKIVPIFNQSSLTHTSFPLQIRYI